MLTSFVDRAAAHRARRGRLHARGRRRRGAGAARLLRARRPRALRRRLARPSCTAIDVSFGDAEQVFHIGPASCGVYGAPAGVCEAMRRWGTVPLEDLAAPAARARARGRRAERRRRPTSPRSSPSCSARRPRCAALWAPDGRILREGELLRNPELGEALMRLARDGAEPFYRGDIAAAVCDWLRRARRLAHRARTSPATARSSASPCGSPTATARSSPTRRPRPAARCSPTRSRCSTAGPRRRRCAGIVARDGRRAGRAHAGVRRRPRPGGLPRALPRRAPRLDHAHLGDRRGRLRVQRHLHQRRGLGRGGAGHRACTSTT